MASLVTLKANSIMNFVNAHQPLCGVEVLYMICFYWLIKKLLSAKGLTEYSQAGQDRYRMSRGSQRDAMDPPERKDASC